MTKPKILCLHGFGENAELFKIRSRNFRAIVGDHAELVYLDGPIDIGKLHTTTGDLTESDLSNGFTNLAWWWMRRGWSYEARGIGKTLDLISSVLEEQGPFDGILGFSQGAALAIVIAELLAQKGLEGPLSLGNTAHPPIKFLVLAGAFQMEVPEYDYLYKETLAVPSLHIMGTYDTVVEPERSRTVQAYFDKPQVFEFVGGHFIPQSPQCARVMRAFLAPFIPEIDAEDNSAGRSQSVSSGSADAISAAA